MSKNNKEVKEIIADVPTTLEDALAVIDVLKAESEKSTATIAELEEKLAKSKNSDLAAENAELQKTVDQMSQKIQLLEGNQTSKSVLVKDSEGKNFKIKAGTISIEGNKYSSEELSQKPELIDYLVKKQSGFISPVE